MQKGKVRGIFLIILGVLAAGASLRGQNEYTGKSAQYIYVSQWVVPRAQWGEMAKLADDERALNKKLLDDGAITAYGDFVNLIHTEGEPTHGEVLMATSEGNVVRALASFYAAPDATSPVLAASQHQDIFMVSRFHNSRSGTFDGAYISGALFDVKPGQMELFMGLVKGRVVPLLEKELAGGALASYSVDTQNYHAMPPGMVEVVFVATDSAALDKVDGAFESAFSKDTEIGPALSAMTKAESHRDFLYRATHMVVK